MTFKDGTTILGTGSLSGGMATVSTSTLAVGSHTITAVYGGDANFSASTSAVLTQTVNPASKASTTTMLSSSAKPSTFGQQVTFTAAVTASGGTPTGTVTFKDGTTILGTGSLSGGMATVSTSTLAVGSHTITAVYGGDANFSASTATLTQMVNQASTTTTVASSDTSSVFGQKVTFTATVAAAPPGAGTPTGAVDFYDGTTKLGTVKLVGGTTVSFTTTKTLSVGSHSVTATYTPDAASSANFAASTSAPLSLTITKRNAR